MSHRTSCASVLALVALSSSAPAQTVLFQEDFESGLANWSISSQWQHADSSAICGSAVAPFPSGVKAARFGHATGSQCNFNGSIFGDLTLLTPIPIPASATDVRLRYRTYEETECPTFNNQFGNCGWDHRFVSVSIDAGQSWTDVAFGAEELAWHEKAVSLDAFAGQDVLLRFRFDPVDGLWNEFLGWFVDDVIVEYGAPGPLNYCTAKMNSAYCTPTITYSGWPSISGGDDLHIGALQILNRRASKLVWSRSPNSQPFHGGILCVQAPAARTTVMDSGGTPMPAWDCTGIYWFHFSSAYLATKSVTAGDTIYVQFSGRDPGYAPPYNHSLSAALQVTILP
jgi:hypothetical protein